MAFNFNRLFPGAAKKKAEQRLNNLLYIILVEWKWDYETFLETPIPIIFRVLRVHDEVEKAKRKANKKRK